VESRYSRPPELITKISLLVTLYWKFVLRSPNHFSAEFHESSKFMVYTFSLAKANTLVPYGILILMKPNILADSCTLGALATIYPKDSRPSAPSSRSGLDDMIRTLTLYPVRPPQRIGYRITPNRD